MPIVYIALGTNLGDREGNLREADRRLQDQVTINGRSKIYETEPWGVVGQPRFLNQVLRGETTLEPLGLLHFLKTIEQDMGRSPTFRFGPRLIDLDILLYDGLSIRLPELTIPHARLPERRFVLVPLAEIAPDLIHPTFQRTIRELLSDLTDDGSVRLLG